MLNGGTEWELRVVKSYLFLFHLTPPPFLAKQNNLKEKKSKTAFTFV